MPSRTATVFLAFAALAAFPLQAQHATTFPPGWVHERPVPKPRQAVSPMPNWYEVRGGSWQVPPETLRRLAVRLQLELDGNAYFNKPKPDHAIQFRGDTVDGRRIVRLVGTCLIESIPQSILSDGFLVIRDGGKCVFDAEYDPANEQLSFRYHGYA